MVNIFALIFTTIICTVFAFLGWYISFTEEREVKIYMLFNDYDYMSALIDEISKSDNSIVIEIIESYSAMRKLNNSFLLTDIVTEKYFIPIVRENSNTVVLMTKDTRIATNDDNSERIFYKRILKYQNVNNIIAQIKEAWNDVYHASEMTSFNVKDSMCVDGINLIGVMCDGNNIRALSVSDRMARQVIYRTGDNVAIVSLCGIAHRQSKAEYISSENDLNEDLSNNLGMHKFVYLLENSMTIPKEFLVREDTFGVGTLMLPYGINPLMDIESEIILAMLIQMKSYGYHHILLVFGDHITRKNFELIAKCTSILWINETRDENIYIKVRESLNFGFIDENWCVLDVLGNEKPLDIWIDDYVSSICKKKGVYR